MAVSSFKVAVDAFSLMIEGDVIFVKRRVIGLWVLKKLLVSSFHALFSPGFKRSFLFLLHSLRFLSSSFSLSASFSSLVFLAIYSTSFFFPPLFYQHFLFSCFSSLFSLLVCYWSYSVSLFYVDPHRFEENQDRFSFLLFLLQLKAEATNIFI